MDTKTVTIAIPARLESKRLPRKPLLQAGGVSLIIHTIEAVDSAFNFPVIVLTDSQDIVDCVNHANIEYCTIRSDYSFWCGTQRIAASVKAGNIHVENWDCTWGDVVVNLQCDEPCIRPEHIHKMADALEDSDYAISTLVAPLAEEARNDPNVTKAYVNYKHNQPLCEDFSRTSSDTTIDGLEKRHHVGVYAFKKDILFDIAELKQSPRSYRLSLEQLTWLDHGGNGRGFEIVAVDIDEAPLSINTQEDYEKWKAMVEGKEECVQ